ncbi:ribosomal protein [Apiospora rasikravindrae]|uniref:Ribosomal protein n=1 Tax=Apiospora rasikravindrae TaxID=990691 RepID=A0ABR1TGM7_9PEZI
MEARPVLRQLTTLFNSCSRTGQTRLQSSTRRTKKALKLPPHPSFLVSGAEADHITYNPRFLPPSDPRRQAQLSSLLRSSTGLAPTAAATNSTTTTDREIPALEEKHQVPVPKFNVTREQVAEMRALRAADPTKWSVVRLAEKFECSKLFVMICCKASAEHQVRERERKEAIKARWGPIRSQAREDRKKRRTLLLRGEL